MTGMAVCAGRPRSAWTWQSSESGGGRGEGLLGLDCQVQAMPLDLAIQREHSKQIETRPSEVG